MRGYTAEDAKEAALTGAATLRAKNDRLVEMVGDPKRLVLESSNKSLTAENEELREKIQRLSKKSYELGTRASEKTIEAPEYTGSGAYSEYMCKYKAQAEDKKKQLEKDFEELKLNRDQAFRCLEQWNTQNEKQALRMKHLAKEHEELGASHQDAIVKMKTLSKSRNTHLNSIAELKKKVEDQVKELAAARATSAEMFQGRMSLGKQVSKLESGVKVLGKEEDAACSISERLFREAREIGCLTMTENGPGIIQNVGLQEELDLRNDIQVFIKQSCTTPYARHEENRRIAEQNDRIKTPKAASGRKVSRLARLCQVHKDEQQKPTTKNADPKAQLEAGGKFWFENYRHMEEVRDGLQKKFEDQQNEYEGCNSNRTRRIGGLRSEPADAKSKIAALKMGNASLRAECKRLWDAVEDANVECKRWHDKFEDANVEREWLEEKVREHDPEFWSLLERKWDELDEKYEWVEEAWLTEDELDEDEPGEEDESDEEAGQKEEADLEKRDREADFEEWVNLIDWEGGERSDMAEYQMEEDDERDGEIALESQGDWL
jgi:chromosome segregation ATPase